MATAIQTDRAPRPRGAYSQAVKAHNFLFIAGQIPLDPKTQELVSEEISDQAHQVMKSIKAILEAANLDFSHVVKMEIFLKDISDSKLVNDIYGSYLTSDPKPARITLEVSRLPLDVKIEISAIAAYP